MKHSDSLKKKIILVDDELPFFHRLSRCLEEYAEISHFSSYSELYSYSSQLSDRFMLSCNAFIFDIYVPGVDGYSFFDAYFSKATTTKPYFFLSFDSSEENACRALTMKPGDFLTKSMSDSELRLRIKNSIDKPQNNFLFLGSEINIEQSNLKYSDGSQEKLTLVESRILSYLSRNPIQSWSKKQLSEWAWSGDVSLTSVRAAIFKLNGKISKLNVSLRLGKNDLIHLDVK